jgi:hypothetical protein
MAMQSDTSSQMFEMIKEWQQSGLTQTAWCRSRQIAYHRFHYWYKRFKSRPNTSVASSANSPFITLEVQQASSVPCYAEVVCPDGRRILFHQGVDASYLKALLW